MRGFGVSAPCLDGSAVPSAPRVRRIRAAESTSPHCVAESRNERYRLCETCAAGFRSRIKSSPGDAMGHWNQRVIRKPSGEEDGGSTYEIHEVYYDDQGRIEAWTENPVQPFGDSPAELREDIRWFLQACRRSILEQRVVDGRETLIPDDEDPELRTEIDDGHYFELMDRAAVALDYIYQYLGSHPVLRRQPELEAIYQRAETALGDLYQAAGRLEFDPAVCATDGPPEPMDAQPKTQ